MKIALTGASGFVGAKLAKALVDRGYDLKVLYNRTPPPEHERITAVRGGLGDLNVLRDLVRGCEVVIHCAALVAAANRDQFFEANVQGTQNMVEAAQEAGVKRFLLLSSVAAREPQISDYAASKKESENYVMSAEGLAWDILRPPGIYGPGDERVLDLVKIVNAGIGFLPAGADARLSVAHVDDVVGAMVAWVRAEITTQGTYEIAGPEPEGLSWRELVDVMAEALGRNVKPVTPPKWLLRSIGALGSFWASITGKPAFVSSGKVGELQHTNWVCDVKPYEQVFKFSPSVSFERGFYDTLQWYRQKNLI